MSHNINYSYYIEVTTDLTTNNMSEVLGQRLNAFLEGLKDSGEISYYDTDCQNIDERDY